jgi:predicted dehydrogenase
MANVGNKKLKAGVVGLGKMGIMHACLLNVMPSVTLAALCDKSRLLRMAAKRVFKDCTVTESLDKFSDLDLDFVYVTTPIPSHYSIIKEILNENLAANLFVEKTLSSRYALSEELCKLVENRRGVYMVGYMKRFGVTFNQAKKILVEQLLGDLISFDAYAFSSDFAESPEGSSISAARGGVLEDLGSHVVDLSIWLFGEMSLSPTKATSENCQKSIDSVTFDVTGKGDLHGKFDVSWTKKGYRMPEFGLTIHGTKGKMNVNDDEVQIEINHEPLKRWYRQDLNDNVRFFLGGPEYYRENEHFIKSIISGTPLQSDFKSAAKVDFLLDQVRCKADA